MSGIYNVRLFSRLQGQGMLNRFFYLVGGDGDAELLCHGLLTTMLESMREGSSSELEFIGLSAKSVFPALPDEYVMNISPVKGYRGAASMPAFVNTTVTLASAYISGRRGRKAMSGTPEGAVTAGELTADMRASLELLGSGLLKQYDVTHGGVTALIMPMMAQIARNIVRSRSPSARPVARAPRSAGMIASGRRSGLSSWAEIPFAKAGVALSRQMRYTISCR